MFESGQSGIYPWSLPGSFASAWWLVPGVLHGHNRRLHRNLSLHHYSRRLWQRRHSAPFVDSHEAWIHNAPRDDTWSTREVEVAGSEQRRERSHASVLHICICFCLGFVMYLLLASILLGISSVPNKLAHICLDIVWSRHVLACIYMRIKINRWN
jgi:hypothetical protein